MLYNVGVHLERRPWKSKNGKTYLSILLRHSYRENGKVCKRTIANLTHYPPQDVRAIELALKYKGDLGALGSLKEIQLKEGLSVGAVWAVYQVAKRLGVDKALGNDFAGKLAMWQVVARVIDPTPNVWRKSPPRVRASVEAWRPWSRRRPPICVLTRGRKRPPPRRKYIRRSHGCGWTRG